MVHEVEQQSEQDELDMNRLKLYAELQELNAIMQAQVDLVLQQPESKKG